jgi:hypothetical protein
MAADALARLGASNQVHRWVDGYARRLDAAPGARWPIYEADWRESLGDATRVGDWIAFFDRLVHAGPWEQVLIRWWPRLLPGAVASATHRPDPHRPRGAGAAHRGDRPRIAELAHARGYWAARWQPLPGARAAHSGLPVRQALPAVPALGVSGGIRTPLAAVQAAPEWSRALRALAPVDSTDAVPRALDDLTDAAVSR